MRMHITRQRLVKAASLIALLDQRRQVSEDPNLGSNIESMIIDRELRELEEEIALNPGPLAARTAPLALRQREPAADR